MNRLKALWASLPHQIQVGIVVGLSAAGASLAHAVEDAGLVHCATWACFGVALKEIFSPHMILTAVFAGAAALKVFYMTPNRPTPEPVAELPKPAGE